VPKLPRFASLMLRFILKRKLISRLPSLIRTCISDRRQATKILHDETVPESQTHRRLIYPLKFECVMK